VLFQLLPRPDNIMFLKQQGQDLSPQGPTAGVLGLKQELCFRVKETKARLGMGVHACNPSYLGN
jgi:hypothetical protein